MPDTLTHREGLERFEAPEQYAGYELHDPAGGKIGKVENVFVNEDHEPEYVRVGTGLMGTKSVLIPVQTLAVDAEKKRLVLQ